MGVTKLLMVALMGITYGWQGDGDGGVEYIVQVSPEELQQISRLGEISSTIDPRIAGHVSRIRIRVGTERLPRETPSDLTGRPRRSTTGAVASAQDRVAVPIPEMTDHPLGHQQAARPIASLDAPRQTALMKPAPDNAGPGFQFPGAQDAVNQATLGIRNGIDQAGREIAGRGQSALENLSAQAGNALRGVTGSGGVPGSGNHQFRVPPPGTRQPNQRLPNGQSSNGQSTGLPPFTDSRNSGGINKAGTAGQGGPSTEPTRRDDSWTDFSGRRSGPTTTPVGSDRLSQNRQGNSLDSPPSTAARGTQSRAGTGTFGQTPAGFAFPPNRQPDARQANNQRAQQDQSGDSLRSGQIVSQQQQWEFDLRQRGLGNVALDRSSFSGTNSPTSPRGVGPYANDPAADSNLVRSDNRPLGNSQLRYDGDVTLNSPFASNDPALNQRQAPRSSQRDSLQPNASDPHQGPDRRLTESELAAGAWTIDRYGRLIDRYGRPLSSVGDAPARSMQPRAVQPDRYDPRQYSSQPNLTRPNEAFAQSPYPRSQTPTVSMTLPPSPNGFGADLNRQPPTLAQTSIPPNIQNSNVRNPNMNPREVSEDPRSLSDRERAGVVSAVSDTVPRRTRNHVAAQPLFNGLLLMSIVANIYLIFWLKNLRVRFRDLVAAKRLAGASAQPG